MDFHERLRQLREEQGRTIEEAADLLVISPDSYMDIESGHRYVNRSERVGIYVMMGMSGKDAILETEKHVTPSPSETRIRLTRWLNHDTDFVNIYNDYISISDRHGNQYEVMRNRVNSPDKLLAFISHMSHKTWMTREHFEELLVKGMFVCKCPNVF
jgi:hypothetical protein